MARPNRLLATLQRLLAPHFDHARDRSEAGALRRLIADRDRWMSRSAEADATYRRLVAQHDRLTAEFTARGSELGALRDRVSHLQSVVDLRTETWTETPVPMVLHCPECGLRHIDSGAQAERAHRTHACQHCGFLWAPAVVATVGVQFLPGCKNVEGAP
jgi:hypothetical protein